MAEPTMTVAPASEPTPPDGSGAVSGRDWPRRWIENLVFAVLVYVPILLMAPGKVESDTKSYLYLDPGRLLDRATTLWTPSVGMGGLSHQTIGYLFPMGPYYWIFEEVLHVPDWIAQRLWLGTIVFLAGIGVRYMLRTLGVRGVGVPVAMVVYAFTPYVLGNSAQYTTLLGPWAAMPWWIAFMALALRRGGWKYPALFAIAVQLVAALNGTALIYGLIAPAMWLLYSLFVTRESTLRRTWTVVWRTGLLTSLTSLWWFISLSVEGEYGLNLLRFTESIRVVSISTLPAEILRGLGNWYFYGGDRTGLWSDARPFYTQRFWLIFISLLVPALALLAAAVTRWRYKAFFVLLILVGVAIAVGPSPYDDPSILGGAYKEFALSSAFGFALRNTVRAVPMVALGVAVLLGAGVSSMVAAARTTRWRPIAGFAAALVLVICLVNAIPALTGNYYNEALQRDPEVPQYWQDAVKFLDERGDETRVLALPGTSFATYRWGDMKDALEPGLMDRPYVDRELVPAGSEPAANLVQSLDQRLQERSLTPSAVAPVARLMGVGDVELRMDLQTDQYGLIPATELWKTFTDPVPAGLGEPVTFGRKIPGRLEFPDPGDLSRPGAKAPDPPPVAVLPVENPLAIARAKSRSAPLIVDGDGAGIVDTAAAGLLDAQRLVLYSAPFEHRPEKLREIAPGATLIVTDSNRRRGTRWAAMTGNHGYTEQTGEEPLVLDPLDQRLEPFAETTDASRTVTILSGVKSIRASTYGPSSYNYAPETRPSRVLDGDLDTAWLVDPGEPVGKERLRIELERPITTDRLNLVQLSSILGSLEPPDPRHVTKISLRFDDGDPIERVLGQRSRMKAGQSVRFPRQTFSTLEMQIEGVHGNDRRGALVRRNAVGFNEIRLRDEAPGAKPVRIEETQRLPTDLLDAFGKDSATHPLALILSREPTMDEEQLSRTFSVPTPRSFTLSSDASLSGRATDAVIDGALGRPGVAEGGVTTTSSSKHSLGNPIARSSSAIDGDPATAWVSPIRNVVPTMKVQVPEPITIDHLDLQLVADGRHSVPSKLTITAGDGTERIIELPVASADAQPGGTLSVPVQFLPLSGSSFTFAVTRFAVLDRGGDGRPAGIAELGIPGVQHAPLAAELPGDCTSDIVDVDGEPFPVRITGTTDDAIRQRPLTIEPCDPAAAVALAGGTHNVKAKMSPGNPTGFDITRIVLTSGADGDPIPPAELASVEAAGDSTARPRVRVVNEDATSLKLKVNDASEPFWLVLGQSYNKGWEAKADGKTLDAPTLVDGYANGWQVQPSGRGPMTITLEWTPQRSFEIAVAISLAASLVCVGIVIVALVRRRRREAHHGSAAASAADPLPPVVDHLAVGAPPAPSLISSLLTRSLPRRRWATVGTVALAALAAALLVRPWVGLLVGALVLLAILSPKWRVVLRFTPALIVLGVAVYMAISQRINRYTANFDWPTQYSETSIPTWIAVMLLAADAVISMVWRSDDVASEPGKRE